MRDALLTVLDIVQGPLFRLAFALMLLGFARALILAVSDLLAARVVVNDARVFRERVMQRVLWYVFPSVLMRRLRPGGSTGMYVYHLCLCGLALIVRIGAILLPIFMPAHIYLWERWLHVAWPAIAGRVADIGSTLVICAGVLLFLGRLYSPMLRKVEPPWSFFKPLILVLPFATGMLAMHPWVGPVDYHVVRLLHVLSALLVFVLVPFGRMLSCMHARLTDVLPETAWDAPVNATPGNLAGKPVVTT